MKPLKNLADGEPCQHHGCANHVTHPCECCGRINARGEYRLNGLRCCLKDYNRDGDCHLHHKGHVFKYQEQHPIDEGWYLAFNCVGYCWEVVFYRVSEEAWDTIPYDRGSIYTHWSVLPDKPRAGITFSIEDCEHTCMLKDGKSGMIIQVNSQKLPFDVSVQVPGELEARVITWDKFEHVNGVAFQVRN